MGKVTVVGGGLAGMIAALRLLQRGCEVTIFDSANRLGGKAGAMLHGSDFDEHGYHIFPDWYRNSQALAKELGISASFVDCINFFQLEADTFPQFRNYQNITSARFAIQNIPGGVLPVFEAILFYYAALDLMSQPYLYRAQLDQITITGFLRSRLYRTDRVVSQFQELMLKGISVPTYEVSAMTMRNVMRFWVTAPEPMMRILKGNLQELWIQPLQSKIQELGGQVCLGHSLTRLELQNGKIARLHFTMANGALAVEEISPDQHAVISAIPAENLAALLDDDLYTAAPDLANIQYLRARPMSAFNLYLKRLIEGMPKGHVNLVDSRYGISFLDVAQFWPGYNTTVLNCIASDTLSLAHLSSATALAALMDDFHRYFPQILDEDIAKIDFQNHVLEPLFMNNVGNWAYRPSPQTQIPNLYLAGDYCRSAIDLVCMEGALSTGLLAAEAVRTALGCPGPIEVLVPKQYPTWLLLFAKVVLAPVALLAFVGAYVTARLRGESIRH